jgi:hypothetical protein
VLSELAKAGYAVLIPFGVARYDMAIDDGSGKIQTVQCKTGRVRRGCIIWAACSMHTLTHTRTSYREQVDFFGVWCPEVPEFAYLVPVAEIGEREGCLRIEAAQRNYAKLRWAEDYKIKQVSWFSS